MQPGFYNTGFNWSNIAYSGAKVIMQGVSLAGIFHAQSSGIPSAGDPKLTNMRVYGNFSLYDRLGLNNIKDVTFDKVTLLSDGTKNVSSLGSKGLLS